MFTVTRDQARAIAADWNSLVRPAYRIPDDENVALARVNGMFGICQHEAMKRDGYVEIAVPESMSATGAEDVFFVTDEDVTMEATEETDAG